MGPISIDRAHARRDTAEPGISVTVVRTRAELRALSEDWSALVARTERPNIFLSPEWVAVWLEHYAAETELRSLVAHRRDELIGVAPLLIDTVGRLRRRELRFIGNGQAAPEHLEFVCAPGDATEVARAFASTIAAFDDVDLVRFDDLRETGPTIDALLQALQVRAWRTSTAVGSTCLYLPIEGTWDDRLSTLSRNARQQIRRMPRRLEQRTGASVKCCSTEAEVLAALDALERWNPQRWSARGMESAFADATFASFHRAFALVALRAGWLRLAVVGTDTETMAVFYAFHHCGIASFYNAAFDPAYADLAVGQVVFASAIEAAHADGLVEYDFLRGDYDYKRRWDPLERSTVSVRATSGSARGRLWRRAATVRGLVASVMARLPAGARTAIDRVRP